MALVTEAQNWTLDKLYRDGTTFYVALLLQLPALGSTGSTIVEPEASEYERIEFIGNATNFSEPSNGRIENLVEIKWALTQSSWGIVQAVGLTTAAEDGMLVFWDHLTSSTNIPANRRPRITPGKFVIEAVEMIAQ